MTFGVHWPELPWDGHAVSCCCFARLLPAVHVFPHWTNPTCSHISGRIMHRLRTCGDVWKQSRCKCVPGVGVYTGNAMASIACGEHVAVVDGNVIRVLARLRRLTLNPKASEGVKVYADLATALLDPARPGDFNQVYKSACL
jgi:hypothetical protein